MSDPAVTREHDPSKGRYLLRAGGAEDELTYSIVSPSQVIADHAEVPASMRETGAGLRLVERLVADARAEGFRIVALCPFVRAEARKHLQWADAFG